MIALSLWRGPITVPETLSSVASEIASRHGVTVADLRGLCRERHLMWPRQEFMATARERTSKTYTQIGRFLGGRDHSTVIHGVRAHRGRAGK